ncbi:chaperonin 10-like protein [Dactylonectria estremocensis]|uniref:Chaperonin 10-like protein n=1 Tax=Dactylonectria estremocensis TaxID=1079267 RepID=A0A9P9IHZ3_9HYPO|nr:chaperonin 10-like protein [Dactylonectria estremocensis]
MHAFQYLNSQTGLEPRDIPVPEPGNGQVQLEVKAAGMCHSDCHIVSGTSDAWLIKKPITLGHEVAGIITKVGPGVTGFSSGDRVAVSQVCHPVEERDWSLGIGLGFDGGYAQYAVAPVRRLMHIPNGVSFAQAAVATDALATSYHAVVAEAGAKPGITVGVIGLGGLGMSGLTFGVLQGAIVYGIDIVEDKFEEAKQLGAHGCFKSIDEAEGVSFDAIVDFAGTGSSTQGALSAVKQGGKVVVVGLASKTVTVPTDVLVLRTVALVGSLGASVEDLAEVLKLLQERRIDPLLVEVPFSEIPASIGALAKGGVKGRLWADPSKE